jgi:integrating conjugative element protein (TIGR03765 family)
MSGRNPVVATASRIVGTLIIIATTSTAIAEPIVIHDSGNTRPITDYLFPPRPESLPQFNAPPPIPNAESLLSRIFPVHTEEMTPGAVRGKSVDLPQLPRPIFLIGTDDRSRNWLIQHRDRLREVQAVGLVVEALNEHEFRAIEQIAQGLDLAPAPASELAKQFNLRHYPVLIGRNRIEQ